jgi:hypothetical protein
MRAALVLAYLILAGVCSLDLFREADFMYTLFFVSSCSLLCALIATQIDSLFAELFVILQATAILTYFVMALSYLFYDANLMLELNNINNSLLIADIIALIGVMLGDRWLYSGAS